VKHHQLAVDRMQVVIPPRHPTPPRELLCAYPHWASDEHDRRADKRRSQHRYSAAYTLVDR
jgi:hypothetical protein